MLQALFHAGSAGSPPSRPIASSGRSTGGSTGFRKTAARRISTPPTRVEPVGGRRHGRHRRVLHAGADDRLHHGDPIADGDVAAVSERARRRRTPRTTRCAAGIFPRNRRARNGRSARGRARAAAVERRRRRPRRAVPAARVERDERAASEPALSRSAHAARASPRRLHRQRQRRADGAGVPAGGARRAARDRVARERRATIASAFSARASDRASRC